jgi:hypothetical protein
MPQITISSPGNGNPCHPVNSSGCISAAGTFDGNLERIMATVVAGTPSSIPCPPSGGIQGALGSGSSWQFGGSSLVCGARSGCQQNTLIVWGFFAGVANPVCTNIPFRGGNGSGSCSGVSRTLSAPIFELAPAKYLMKRPKTGKTAKPTAGKRLAGKNSSAAGGPPSRIYDKNQYVLRFDTNGSSLDAPVWNLAKDDTPPGVEQVTLQVLNVEGQTVGILICREKFKEGKEASYRRHLWSCRAWDFCGENWLHSEPYAADEKEYPPWIIHPE